MGGMLVRGSAARCVRKVSGHMAPGGGGQGQPGARQEVLMKKSGRDLAGHAGLFKWGYLGGATWLR